VEFLPGIAEKTATVIDRRYSSLPRSQTPFGNALVRAFQLPSRCARRVVARTRGISRHGATTATQPRLLGLFAISAFFVAKPLRTFPRNSVAPKRQRTSLARSHGVHGRGSRFILQTSMLSVAPCETSASPLRPSRRGVKLRSVSRHGARTATRSPFAISAFFVANPSRLLLISCAYVAVRLTR
jgi:hypothetical protein